jgi:hypothetical protein
LKFISKIIALTNTKTVESNMSLTKINGLLSKEFNVTNGEKNNLSLKKAFTIIPGSGFTNWVSTDITKKGSELKIISHFTLPYFCVIIGIILYAGSLSVGNPLFLGLAVLFFLSLKLSLVTSRNNIVRLLS